MLVNNFPRTVATFNLKHCDLSIIQILMIQTDDVEEIL
jgi:hypothetical protein